MTTLNQQISPVPVTGAPGTGPAIPDARSGRGTSAAMAQMAADSSRLPDGLLLAIAGFDAPASVAVALDGAGRTDLLTPSSEPAEAQQRPFADPAVHADVRHLILLPQLAARALRRPCVR